MKKRLLTLAASLGLFVSMFAATDMCVIKKNGEIVKFDVDEVKEVIYQKQTDSPIIETPAVDAAASDLRYFILNDYECEVTGVINGSANIVVPERVIISGKTYTVTGIGEEAFNYQRRIKTVTLPNTIKTIGEDAFEGCESLTSINLPDGLETIGSGAFEDCAFKELSIPSSVTEIESGAFDGCYGLTPGLLVYDKGEKCYGWIGDPDKCIDVVIPEGVSVIKYSAFEEMENLSTIEIPSSVTSVESYAFSRCSNLKSITIPSSVISIGHGAFANCQNLDVIVDNVQENIKFYDYSDSEDGYFESTMEENNAFYNCKSVKFNNGIQAGDNQIIIESDYINVVSGGKYVVYNPSIEGGELKFEVLRVSGTAGSKVVEFKVILEGDEADGKVFALGDDADHASYFGRVDGKLQPCKQFVAVEYAPNILFALSSSVDDYMIISATVNKSVNAAGATVSKFGTITTAGSSTVDPGNTDMELVDPAEEIQVVVGGTYYATNYIKDFSFKVLSVEGSYTARDQVVTFKIDGQTFTLSDAGASYLMWTEEYGFEAVGKAVADRNAENIVMFLACANSSADYSFVSPTHNASLYSGGARKTLFSDSLKSTEDQTSSDEIQVKAGGIYYASNPVKDFTFKVLSVSGHYVDQSQVVVIEIDGEEFTLSDAGASYLMWNGNQFVEATTSTARNGAKNVVACLSLASSQADYTITSATNINTLKSLGANQTTFIKR